MKPVSIAGIVLIILGVAGFAVDHIDYTTREKVIDFGPVEVRADKPHRVAIPDIAAAIVLLAGVGLVAVGLKRT